MNILLICTGNTCRSPMAEGILKKMLPQHNISSAGISTVDGLGASDNALEASSEIEVDLTSHKSRKLTYDMLKNSDLILCMTENHKRYLSDIKGKTFTLSEFAGTNEDINDPYGGNLECYRACRDQMLNCLKIAAEKINDKNFTV